MVLTTTASDDFNRSNEDLDASSDWTAVASRSGTLTVTSNHVESSTSSSGSCIWNTALGGGSELGLWAEVDYDFTSVSSGYAGICLLESATNTNGYMVNVSYYGGGPNASLTVDDSSDLDTASSIGTTGTLRVEWYTDGTLKGYLNGSEFLSGTDATRTPVYGAIIVDYDSGVSPQFDNFAAGTIVESLDIYDATSSGNNSPATPQNVAYPAHNSGDLIVQSISIDGNVDLSAIPSTGPNGETIVSIALDVDPGTSGPQFSAWYWIATSNTTAGNISVSLSSAEQTSSEAFRVPAGTFDASNPIPFSTTGTQSSGTGATITMPSFGGAGVPAGGLVVAMGGVDTDPMNATFSPTGWTDVIDHDQGATSTWVARRDALTTADETISSAAFGINTDGDSAACVGFIIAAATGATTVTLPVISASGSLYGPSVSPGAVSATLPLISTSASLYGPSVSPGAVGLSMPSIASTASLFAQSVSVGAVDVSLPTLVSSATLFAPGVALGVASQSLVLPTIVAGSVLHEMTLAPGAVSLVLPLIASGATLYASTVSAGTLSVVLPVISESSVYAGSVSVGSVSVSLPTISSGAALFAVAVAAGTATVSLPLIASAATLYVGTLTVGNATVTLPAISGGSVLYSQTIVGGTISPNVNDIPASRNNVILTKLDRAGRRLAMLEKNP